ncbi:NTP transferase domain-containing protein [Elusimicrobiota bacterium]
MKDVVFIILAGGKGIRLGAETPKPIRNIGNMTLLERVANVGRELIPTSILAVVSDERVAAVARELQCDLAWQEEPRGTADALRQALKVIDSGKYILVTCVDIPFIRSDVFSGLFSEHINSNNFLTVLTAYVDNPSGYGRVVMKDSQVKKIVEEKEASDAEKKINLINSGIYCISLERLKECLDEIERSPEKNEYYLTDIIEIALGKGLAVSAVQCDYRFIKGINTPAQLIQAQETLD